MDLGVLRQREFRLVFLAQGVSVLGDRMVAGRIKTDLDQVKSRVPRPGIEVAVLQRAQKDLRSQI